MRRLAPSFAVVLLVAGLLLPAVEPLFDHHFAERHPGHRHIGLVGPHIHAYEDPHHVHAPHEEGFAGGWAVALFNYDAGLVALIAVAIDDTAMRSFLLFEPGSIFMLPLLHENLAKPTYPHPPDHPPRLLA